MNWILELVAILVGAAVVGRLARDRLPVATVARHGLGLLVYPLVGVQGVVIGLAPGLLARLPTVGLQAAGAALLTLGASAAVARMLLPAGLRLSMDPVPRVLSEDGEPAEPEAGAPVLGAAPPPGRALLAAARVLLAVVLGVAVGHLGYWPAELDAPAVGAWLLRLLVAVVGLDLGSGDDTLERAVREGPRLLLVPAAAVLGTALAAVVLWLWLGQAGLAAAAGLGWYTLAGAMVTDVMGAEAGALAFLVSLFRELWVVVLAPVLVSRLGGLPAVAAAGAPAMDTTLPFLVRAGGNGLALPALVSGGVCSLLAPWALGLVLAW